MNPVPKVSERLPQIEMGKHMVISDQESPRWWAPPTIGSRLMLPKQLLRSALLHAEKTLVHSNRDVLDQPIVIDLAFLSFAQKP